MIAFVHIREETQPDCTGVEETTAVGMLVADTLYVCMVVEETTPLK